MKYMTLDLFDHLSYKEYLGLRVETEAQLQRGFRTKFCEHVGCQLSYLSQVINGKPDFTLEQAFRANQFLAHDQQESKYFLLLVQYARAATHELQEYLKQEIREFQKSRSDLKKRLKKTQEITLEDQHKYYSTWYYSAIYVLISIPGFQEVRTIERRLHLPQEIVLEAVQFLEGIGLIEKKDGAYQVTKKNLHLSRDSAFIQRHHINWRSQSLQSAEKNLPGDLHYSMVLAISKADFERVKDVFIRAIEASNEIMKPSPEEEIYGITLDLFRL